MNSPDFPAVASRLCADCGLCCNGVMFRTVRLQAGDSAKALSALGLKLKRKQGQNYLLQPCPAFQAAQCSIYAARPQRCRLFECRQLKRLAAGETTETAVREMIREARRQVAELEAILAQGGGTNVKRPLSKRYAMALAELDASADETAPAIRDRLTQAMKALSALLNREFRIVPTTPMEDSEGEGETT